MYYIKGYGRGEEVNPLTFGQKFGHLLVKYPHPNPLPVGEGKNHLILSFSPREKGRDERFCNVCPNFCLNLNIVIECGTEGVDGIFAPNKLFLRPKIE